MSLDTEWMVSEYLDDGRIGIITVKDSYIVIGVSLELSRELAERIVAYHNTRCK